MGAWWYTTLSDMYLNSEYLMQTVAGKAWLAQPAASPLAGLAPASAAEQRWQPSHYCAAQPAAKSAALLQVALTPAASCCGALLQGLWQHAELS